MAAVEISSTTTSCYERAFDDLAGERLLNLEFEMLKHYEITYFKKTVESTHTVSSGDKIPCNFQCSNVFRGFEN